MKSSLLTLNAAIQSWLEQTQADEAATAGLAVTMEYTPSDALRDTLRQHAPLTSLENPGIRQAFGNWLAEMFLDPEEPLDTRAPTLALLKAAMPLFHQEMSLNFPENGHT